MPENDDMPEPGARPEPPSSSNAFAGDPREEWSLSGAVDALGDAARSAGRPGAIWVAGIGFPTIGLGVAAGLVGSMAILEVIPKDLQTGLYGVRAHGREIMEQLGSSGGPLPLALFPFWLVIFRLRVGLARIAPPAVWNRLSETFGRPRLRQAWRAGKGLTLGACGMSFMLNIMMAGVLALVIVPVMLLLDAVQSNLGQGFTILAWVGILMPGTVLLTAYAVLLSVLHQLGLQSLAHNRRGVSSALVHAWRVAKANPWGTARTVVVDLVLDLSIWVITLGLAQVLRLLVGGNSLFLLTSLMLMGFGGVARAGYWARAYRALGGLSPDDQVPGLQAKQALPGEDGW